MRLSNVPSRVAEREELVTQGSEDRDQGFVRSMKLDHQPVTVPQWRVSRGIDYLELGAFDINLYEIGGGRFSALARSSSRRT